jgi:uncharacterized membrane protein YhaH (DUF805 family)
MPQTDAHPAKRIDAMFWYSALACLATSVVGAWLLKFAFSENPADTGIAKSYAVGICSCLILALPAFLITVRWSAAGAIGMWLLTAAVAALATLGGAFGLATPLIAILIFAASISTATYFKDRKPAQNPETSGCPIDTAE